MKNNNILPFGLLFEEEPTSNPNIVEPIYDEDNDISVVFDKRGNSFPFVEYSGITGTKTATKTINEGSDDDDEMITTNGTNTRTVTETQAEEADSDNTFYSTILRTRTDTFDSSEQSDEDDNATYRLSSSTNTKTATSTFGEDTDDDVE
jgi:hypothetical protein